MKNNENAYDEIYKKSRYMGVQYKRVNASTTALIEIMEQHIHNDEKLSLLDAGCGDGAVLYSISQTFKNLKCTGFDYSNAMVSYAIEHLPENIKILQGNIYDVDDLTRDSFDIVTCIHTLSLVDEFEKPLSQLISKANKYVFINSLFSSHNVDLKTVMREDGYPPIIWNIWSMKRFKGFALEHGAKHVEFKKFMMPYDLPFIENGTGSYTKRLSDGKRITFTGPLYLPWYFAIITK